MAKAKTKCNSIYRTWLTIGVVLVMALSLVSVFAEDSCVDPDVADSNYLSIATTATYGAETYSDKCADLKLYEATCNAGDEGNPFLDYSLYDCPSGTKCVEGACVALKCGDGADEDSDELIDCADISDCADKQASCGVGKYCSEAKCIFNVVEGNYNGKSGVDKEDIQAIKSNPAGFWDYAGKSVKSLNQYIQKMVDNWGK
jgi:hypothetical protein